MTAQNTSSLIKVAGSGCALLYLCLAYRSDGYGDVGYAESASVYGLCALFVFGTAALLGRQREAVLQPAALLPWVLGFALLFRLLGVFTFPILEDDFYRYLWDGRMLVQTGAPYGIAPAEWFGSEALDPQFSAILDGINYPWVATVYGPTLQLLFAAGYVVAPGAVWPLQVAAAVADVGVLLVLIKLCAGRVSLLVGGCLLYAWSPLLIKEFATTAHPDVVGVLFVAAALLLYCRERWFWMGLCLGLATGVKPFALVIAPFLIGFRWRAIAGFVAAIGLVSLPFLHNDPSASGAAQLLAIWLPEGLRVMGDNWLFNAPLYLLAAAASGGALDFGGLKAVLLGGFALVWFWQLVLWLGAEGRGLAEAGELTPGNVQARRLVRLGQLPHAWLFGLFFLVLPVLNPWYLIWWLPFAVLRLHDRPLLTPWVASVAVGLSYASGINLVGGEALELYQIPGWVVVIEFGVIGCAVGWDLRGWRTSGREAS